MATLRTSPAPRDEAIRRLFAEGLSDAEIAERVGVDAYTVQCDRRYLGLQRRPTPAPPVSDDRLRELHAAGLDNVAIAEATSLTRGTVRQRLHLLGLRAHPTPRQLAARFAPGRPHDQ